MPKQMEEVDNIIIHSLRQIGCDIDEHVTNLCGFDTDLVVEATVKCLETIRPGLGISTILPANMAARFRVGAMLAQACSELGYRGDIGYQTFLYSSTSDLRRVFMFLIEKLPKESDKGTSEPISKIDELEKSVSTVVSRQLSSSWLPHYCHEKTSGGYTKMPYKSVELTVPSISHKKDDSNSYTKYQLPVSEQLQNRQVVAPSLITRTAKLSFSQPTTILERLEWLNNRQQAENTIKPDDTSDLRLMSRFSLNERLHEPIYSPISASSTEKEQPQVSTTPTEMSPVKSRAEKQNLEVEKIKTTCQALKIEVETAESEIKKLGIQLSQLSTKQLEEERELQVLENEKKIRAKTYSLLEDGDKNIEKLETIIETEKDKLISLANQWERHRAPLIKKYRDEREKYSAKASTSQKKLDELRQLREKERELIEQCQLKDQQYAQLVTEVQKLPKDLNRSAYTQRILEIINNVRKQKDEIDKVLADTREIKKEINMLSGKLERSFAVVDELIFRDAKTNEASRRAYKFLATLHSDCSDLVMLVEETGSTLREIRDLEEQIDSESTKNIEANLQRITADLEQMRQETASLTSQLASKNF